MNSSGTMARTTGLSTQKYRLAPPRTVKHTGQESGGELYNILKFWSFMQSKAVNNVLQTASAFGGLCPQTA